MKNTLLPFMAVRLISLNLVKLKLFSRLSERILIHSPATPEISLQSQVSLQWLFLEDFDKNDAMLML